VLGLPITLSQALLYALACGLLARSLYRLHGSLAVAVAALVAVEFHPAVFPVQIVRDDISPAQVLLIIVCLLEFMFLQTGVKGRLAWAAAGGFCFVWFWLTREDALWIVPAMAMLGACRLWQCRRRAVPLLTGVFVFAAVAASGWLAVAAVNDAEYGTLTEVDFNTGPFAQAVQQLQRVRVGAPQAYVPVPEKVRLAIYAVSPSRVLSRILRDPDKVGGRSAAERCRPHAAILPPAGSPLRCAARFPRPAIIRARRRRQISIGESPTR
jgi:hypothetical protein